MRVRAFVSAIGIAVAFSAMPGRAGAALFNGDAAQCKERPTNPGVDYDTTGGCSMGRTLGAFTLELGYALP